MTPSWIDTVLPGVVVFIWIAGLIIAWWKWPTPRRRAGDPGDPPWYHATARETRKWSASVWRDAATESQLRSDRRRGRSRPVAAWHLNEHPGATTAVDRVSANDGTYTNG